MANFSSIRAPQLNAGFSLRSFFLGLSLIAMVVCAGGAGAHYHKVAWGNRWHPTGWLLSILFLLLAFSPPPQEIAASVRRLLRPKTGFFLFWIIVFVVSHLWHFRTAPWNGNGLFDDSAVDLKYLKSFIIGHPFQPAWFHPHPFNISRETLFHYYVWGFLRAFGFNILSYEAALLVLWCAVFLFTLLLVDLLWGSTIVTSIVALIFNFFAYSFIYTFVGYRYPMTIAFCLASLYFLYRGLRTNSYFSLSLSGLAAGLCLASSILGKQYFMALAASAVLYAALNWKALRRDGVNWSALSVVAYGSVAAAMPILCYILFNRQDYTFYEGTFLHRFWQAVVGHPAPNDLRYYFTQLRDFFFTVPGPRLLFPDLLPIPLPYYLLLLPGLVLALRHKRYEIALLSIIPVIAVFVSAGGTVEHRMLLAIPFWMILMGFSLAWLLKIKLPATFRIPLWAVSALVLAAGFIPSIKYIYANAATPAANGNYAPARVAVSRFLRNVVAGRVPPNPLKLERNELKRIRGIPDPPYETLICPGEAYSVIHLFLHDYDDARILSFCGGGPMYVMSLQNVWSANKKAILGYAAKDKDLKLIWENDPKAATIVALLRAPGLATEESIGFSFAGSETRFYVMNIARANIRTFQERVRTLPDTLP